MSTPGDVTLTSRLTSAAASAASSHGLLPGGSGDRGAAKGCRSRDVAPCAAGSLVRGFYIDDRHISVPGTDCCCKQARAMHARSHLPSVHPIPQNHSDHAGSPRPRTYTTICSRQRPRTSLHSSLEHRGLCSRFFINKITDIILTYGLKIFKTQII
jgi:hypothetical protein